MYKKIIIFMLLAFAAPAFSDELMDTIVREGLDRKITPHWELLTEFPATIVVEFRTVESDGKNKHRKAATRLAKKQRSADTALISSPDGVAVATFRVKNLKAFLKLLRDPDIISVRPDDDFTPSLAQSLPMVGTVEAATMGFTGKGEGVTVAVIDSGIASYERGSSTRRTPISYNVVARFNYTSPVWYSSTLGGNDSHGSSVANVIFAIAPKAKFIDLRIGTDTVAGTTTALSQAVAKVLELRALYNIKVVNLSMGAHKLFPSDCYGATHSLMTQLYAAGILVTVASGNDGFKTGLVEPACSTAVTAVGAMADDNLKSGTASMDRVYGQVMGFSNSGPTLDLIAPGCVVNTPYMINLGQCGTSMAAPFVAGVALVLQGKEGFDATPQWVRTLLRGANTKKAFDPLNGVSYPVVNLADTMLAAGWALNPSTAVPIIAPAVLKYPTPVVKTQLCGRTGCSVPSGYQ